MLEGFVHCCASSLTTTVSVFLFFEDGDDFVRFDFLGDGMYSQAVTAAVATVGDSIYSVISFVALTFPSLRFFLFCFFDNSE